MGTVEDFTEAVAELPERDRSAVRGTLDTLLHQRQEREAIREALRERLWTHATQQVGSARRAAAGQGGWGDTNERMRDAAWAAVLALLLGAVLMLAPARAVARWCPGPADPDVLARVCAHESGPDALDDCIAIHDAIRGIAEHRALTWDESAWLYSPRALGGETGRPWVAELERVCRVPAGWRTKEDGSWARYEERLAPLFDHADRCSARKLESPCSGTVHDWSARTAPMRARAVLLELVPVRCGRTLNDFYARPSMRRREAGLVAWLDRRTR